MKFHIHSQEAIEAASDGDSRLETEWANVHSPPDDFLKARNGDHLLIPFECDVCIFHKLRNHFPIPSNPKDELLMHCIRRMNLDAFWSRSTSTVKANVNRAEKMIKLSTSVGLASPFIQSIELPPGDHCGYEIAIQILLASRNPGKYSSKYSQFDTVRHLRSTYSNFIRASPQANQEVLAMGDFNGNYNRLVHDKCGSFYFKRFMEGLKARMGQDWRPNMAMSTELLLRVLKEIENNIQMREQPEQKHKWIVFSSYVVVTYVLSLRGKEGLFIDLKGLNKYWNERTDLVKIVLRGKIKGDKNAREHHLPCCNKTNSGIEVRSIISRLLVEKRLRGFRVGPAITDINGKLLSLKVLNDMFFEILTNIFDEEQSLFPKRVSDHESISAYYQCFRTFRRTSDTRALEVKVKRTDIDIVNKWKSDENSKSNKPSLPMHQLYAQLNLFLGPFLRYTKAM